MQDNYVVYIHIFPNNKVYNGIKTASGYHWEFYERGGV